MTAGAVAVEELTAGRIGRMADQGGPPRRLGEALLEAARKFGLPLTLTRAGSLMNLHRSDRSSSPLERRGTGGLMSLLHLAALNRGVFMAPRGLIVLSTVMSEAVISDVADRMKAAMQDVADGL